MYIKVLLTILLTCLCFEAGDARNRKEEERAKFEASAWELRTDLVHNHTYELANLKKADSIYKKSVELNSILGKLYALQIRTYALVGNNRNKEFLATVDEYKKLALDNKCYDEFFDAVSAKVQYLMNIEDYKHSLIEAKDMVAVAEKVNNYNGLYESNLLLGQIYKYRYSWLTADKHLKRSLEAINKIGNNDSIPHCLIYREMAECYSGAHKHDKAIEYALMAKQWANFDIYKYFSDWTLLNILFNAGDMKRFRQVYSKSPIQSKSVLEQFPDDYKTGLQVMAYVANGQYEEAKQLQEKRDAGSEKSYDIYAKIYYHEGDYKKAYDHQLLHESAMDSLEYKLQKDELDELETQIYNTKISTEIKERQNHIIYISVGIIVTFIICTMLYMLHRRSKHNKALSRINKEVEQKNTELLKAQREIQDALTKAENANAMRKHFIENMMHEIRTPLNAISGFTQVLTDSDMEVDKDNAKQIRKIIMDNTESLTTMLNQIIHISSFDSGSEKIATTETSLSEIVGNAVEQCKNIQPGVELIVKTEDAVINTDRRLVSEALYVLLHNASKFTAEGSITVQSMVKGDNAIISVTDTGIGIDEEKAEKIFERFYKIDEFIPGMGLGLSLCRAIISTLGGTVVLDTTYKEQGCRFVITLRVK